MSESVATSDGQPSIPSFQDEPDPTNEPELKNSVFEAVKRAASKVFEHRGILYQKGPGRRRADGGPSRRDIPLNAPATALPAVATNPPAVPDQAGLDPALVKKCCSAVVKAVTGFLDKLLFGKARIAGYEPAEAQKLVNDCTITAAELDSFSELSEVCLRKYGVGTEYAPEIGLGCVVIGVGLRYSVAMKTLRAEAKPENVTQLPVQ